MRNSTIFQTLSDFVANSDTIQCTMETMELTGGMSVSTSKAWMYISNWNGNSNTNLFPLADIYNTSNVTCDSCIAAYQVKQMLPISFNIHLSNWKSCLIHICNITCLIRYNSPYSDLLELRPSCYMYQDHLFSPK